MDAGTTSVKTSVFSKELIMLATSIQEYQLCTVGGFVEVPAQKYITAVCLGIEAVKKAVPNIKISAIGITTQGESFVALDKNGEPLDNFIVWLDSRAENEANQLLKQFSEQRFYEETGLPAITSALPLAKLLWLKNNKNE
ncbi:MAG: FGGY family carbohydrate kinase, partial [Oscillospiraceae bacterium]